MSHDFHIPVMGTGFTLDSALRVAKFGISTVISLADDRVIERVRRHYDPSAVPIRAGDPDARARRITAWLDYVDAETRRQVEEVRAQPLEPGTDRFRHRALLGRDAPVVRGAIECNIMTKVDAATANRDGTPRGPEHSLAKAAVRGFARSTLEGALVLSAGVNPSLFGYLAGFDAFRPDASGRVRKPVVLKVSDLRSAQIQAKFLARRGVPVSEFRVESGLNCGGHVFPTEGELMGPILRAFQQERQPGVRVTVQGGVGTHGEMRRLREFYGADSVGWGSPFLLVPEVVVLDEATRAKLARGEVYTSDASPLGVRFTNLHGSSSEEWSRARVKAGTPGSPCPNKLLAMNTEFGRPLCTASREYQELKLARLGFREPPRWEAAAQVYEKQCICDHLGNGLINGLGIARRQPVAVCPGPNLVNFRRTYSLEEMVDHIYGRGPSLVSPERPHMFAAELSLYLEHFRRQPTGAFRDNLLAGLDHYRELCTQPAYPGENLASLEREVERAAEILAVRQRAASA